MRGVWRGVERWAPSGPVAHVLLCAVNRREPAFAPRNPQFISRREVRGRIVEGADCNFDFVDAIDNANTEEPQVAQK